MLFLKEFICLVYEISPPACGCILGHCSSGAWCDKSDFELVGVRVFDARALTSDGGTCWRNFGYPVCEIWPISMCLKRSFLRVILEIHSSNRMRTCGDISIDLVVQQSRYSSSNEL